MRYNSDTLITYCNEYNIFISNDYTNTNITRESYIQFKCIECSQEYNKTFRQIVKTGAYCQTCMSNIAINKIRNTNVKCDVNMLMDFCDKNNLILLDDYSNQFINRNSLIEGICKHNDCENIFRKPFRELLKINGYCQDCSKENGKVKIIETNLKKYGVSSPLQLPEVREKIRQTTLQKYGVEHNSQSNKIKQQKKEKSLEKYGCEFTLQSPEIRNQIRETNLIKYGVENPQQNKQIKEKTMKTNIELYGCKSPTGNIIVKSKIIQTNLERYGVPHHSQNPEIADNMLTKSYDKKSYVLPSGKTIYIQGYENYMLDYLLSVEKIDENDIFTKRNEVPEIWYNDKTGKSRRHYVDFYIKSQNRCVEVKSTFTNQEKNNVFEKQKAAKDLGLKYEIWIFNKSGDLLDKYI
jgi:hypothetical protein